MPKRSLVSGQPQAAGAMRRGAIALAIASLLGGCLPVHRVPLDLPRAVGDLRRLIAAHCRLPVTRANEVGFLVGGEASHRAMLGLIREARCSVYVEMFIFHFDATGREVADALIQRAQEGLDVRVRLDSLGIEYGREDYKLIDYLQKGGVKVQIHNPYYWSPTGFNITHRKILIADEGHAMTGGVNIGDAFRYGYYDLMLDLRGEAAHHITWIFKRSWGGDLAEKEPPTAHNVYASQQSGSAVGDEALQVALMEPGSRHGQEVRAAYLLAARNAQHTLDVAFPYMWDEELAEAFLEAEARGVRLRLLLPDWKSFDPFHLLNQATARRLAASGAQVALYAPKFLHVKYLSVDGVWSSVGSTNGDTRSLLENYELNVFFFNRATVRTMETQLFEPMWQAAHRVTDPREFEPPADRAWLVPPLEFLKSWF